jgi:hypothetical protein
MAPRTTLVSYDLLMSRIRLVVVYASLVGIPLAALLLILQAGSRLTASGLPAGSPLVAPVGAAQAQSMLTLGSRWVWVS